MLVNSFRNLVGIPPQVKILSREKREITNGNNACHTQIRENSVFILFDIEDENSPTCILVFCKCQWDTAASVGVNGAALLCSLAQIINHEAGHILVVPVLSLLGLIKQFCELESQIPLLQIIINYGESAQRCWTQLYSAQPWQQGDSLFWALHSRSVSAYHQPPLL